MKNKNILNIIKETYYLMFYQYCRYFKKVWKDESIYDAVYVTISNFTIAFIVLELSFLFFIDSFLHVNILFIFKCIFKLDFGGYFMILLAIIFYLLNYFIFIYKKKYISIIKSSDNEINNNINYILYVWKRTILLILIFVLSLLSYINKTELFYNKDFNNQLNEKNIENDMKYNNIKQIEFDDKKYDSVIKILDSMKTNNK